MKIATWNVNSVRARMTHLEQWLSDEAPDIVGLQETKVQDHEFPASDIERLGYAVSYCGQKSYNGTAILSRVPAVEFTASLAGTEKFGARFTAATFDDGAEMKIRFLNVYVINGKEVGVPAWHDKLKFMRRLKDRVATELERYPRLAVVGDFNIAPADRDVYSPDEWRDKILCSKEERASYFDLIGECGLVDSLRELNPDDNAFTWWDYRAARYRRGQGLRIDHILMSPALRAQCTKCYVDETPRKKEKPSDHAPVIAVYQAR